MVQAGVEAYVRYDNECQTLDEFLVNCFRVMSQASFQTQSF